jgi:hypothetical protein
LERTALQIVNRLGFVGRVCTISTIVFLTAFGVGAAFGCAAAVIAMTTWDRKPRHRTPNGDDWVRADPSA